MGFRSGTSPFSASEPLPKGDSGLTRAPDCRFQSCVPFRRVWRYYQAGVTLDEVKQRGWGDRHTAGVTGRSFTRCFSGSGLSNA